MRFVRFNSTNSINSRIKMHTFLCERRFMFSCTNSKLIYLMSNKNKFSHLCKNWMNLKRKTYNFRKKWYHSIKSWLFRLMSGSQRQSNALVFSTHEFEFKFFKTKCQFVYALKIIFRGAWHLFDWIVCYSTYLKKSTGTNCIVAS